MAYRILTQLLCLALLCGVASAQPSFLAFESGQVRPLALSAAGDRLFAVNTPDNRLEILRVVDGRLEPEASVRVGLEPVAVAVRDDTEVWVVNHLSDSVSVVDLSGTVPRVVQTLLVGDEPRDIVFAGPSSQRAFITTAHRGQHRVHPSLAGVPGAGDPRFTTGGVGRADVWVFDGENPGDVLGGRPLAIVELFGDTPRALAVSPDGASVYVAVFQSGNGTTTVGEPAVCDGFAPTDLENACPGEFPGSPGGNPGPATNHQGAPAPEVGLIVQRQASADPSPLVRWNDELGRDWSHAIRFDLPDRDVFAIDAVTLEQTAQWSGVGTVLFNMTVHPTTGVIYVSNTQARNEVRFEGSGEFGGSSVAGHLAESRITVLGEATVEPRQLNKHIDYRVSPAPAETRSHSLATPLDMAVSGDGETLYVAAFGSSRVGVFDTAELEQDTFEPTRASARYLSVTGGGPSGLAIDPEGERLFVLTRFDNSVSVLDLISQSEVQHLALHNPEPARVVEGRPFLYDAQLSSSNGEASCASCHVFGDLDGLAWDLGDPDASVTQSPIPINLGDLAEAVRPDINGTGNRRDFHPMKGPMVTQTLRGMVNAGAMHWRGDRAVGSNGTDPFDSDLSFRNFDVAFAGLLGRASKLPSDEMQRFADFALDIVLPPNPVRALDNSLTPAQRRGRELYFGPRRMDGLPAPSPLGNTCEDCHTLDAAAGHFGTNGEQSFEAESQIVKIPHLRNAYQKVGMFGNAAVAFINPGDNGFMGDQIRGFGFLHDGSIDTLFRFFRATVFNDAFDGQVGFRDNAERRDMEEFVLAFDNDLAPVVGQQITLGPGNAAAVGSRIELLLARAGAPFVSEILGGRTTECDVVVTGVVGGISRGYLYDPVADRFQGDRAGEGPIERSTLQAYATDAGQELTFTCVPPGSGARMALDRDEDGYWDRDELDASSDPADAGSVPMGSCVPAADRLCLNDQRFELSLQWRDQTGRTGEAQVVPFQGADSGLFWFFDGDNWEMLVKVLDGCGVNQRYWVFAAATTNVEYTLVVRDVVTQATRSYHNPLGTRAPAIADTDAFASCGSRVRGPENTDSAFLPGPRPKKIRLPATEKSGCAPGETTLCLNDGRFRVEIEWRDFQDRTGHGKAVDVESTDSGLLWFFQPENWEMLVKVLDGCGVNGEYWVFAAATTTVEYTMTVTDTTTGTSVQYLNPLGTAADAVTDIGAFSCHSE